MALVNYAPQIPTQPSAADVLAAQLRYGPNAGIALTKSQYLAQALADMERSGSQNLRTPAALGSNLIAAALMMRSKDKADQAAMSAYGQDQAQQYANLTHGTPLDPGLSPPGNPGDAPPSAPPPSSGPQGDAPTPATPVPAVADAGRSQPPLQSPAAGVTPDQRNLLARMVLGEAGGEPAAGQQAVAAVALNRARESGQPLDQVLNAPHQFAGLNSRSRGASQAQLAAILQNIDPVVNGQQPDPTGGADHFFAPALANPSWGQGPGQMIGHQKFLALGYGGQPGAGPMPAPGAQPAPLALQTQAPPATPDQTAPQTPPYQVAANGPTPPPPAMAQGSQVPSGAAVGAPAPAPLSLPAGAGAPHGVPLQQVTPQEWALAQQLYNNLPTRAQGEAMIVALRQKAATPLAAPQNMMWGPDGRAVPIPGTQFSQLPSANAADVGQVTPFGEIKHSEIPGVIGRVPPGYVNQNGHLVPIPQQPRQTYRLPGHPGLYVTDANGTPTQVAPDNMTVKDVGDVMKDLTASPQYDKAAKLTEMYRGAVQAAGRPGGISDAELKDNAAQIFSGGVARQFNSKMIDEGQGPWLRLTQVAPEIVSGQKLSPQSRQAILAAMHDYVTEAQGAFNGLAQSKSAYAAQNGIDLGPFIAPLMRPVPGVPDMSGIPTGIGGYGSGAPTGVNSPNGGPPAAPGAHGLGGVVPGMGPGQAAPIQVRTPAEAARLAPGTRIVLPDGSLGVVPGRVAR